MLRTVGAKQRMRNELHVSVMIAVEVTRKFMLTQETFGHMPQKTEGTVFTQFCWPESALLGLCSTSRELYDTRAWVTRSRFVRFEHQTCVDTGYNPTLQVGACKRLCLFLCMMCKLRSVFLSSLDHAAKE